MSSGSMPDSETNIRSNPHDGSRYGNRTCHSQPAARITPLLRVAYRDGVPRSTNSNAGCRILVYGVTGSGKSTAAQRIAARTWLPLTLADELTWAPGWIPVAEDEQRRRLAAVVAQDRWVLDTAYGAWLDR